MDNAEYEAELNDAEMRLERLRARYEQYFRGVDRREPAFERKDVERRMQLLRRERPRNTALRFRSQTLLQRYTTFRTHWNRICRQIENGTYKRDLQRMRSRRERLEPSQARATETDLQAERGVVSLDESLDIDQEVAAALAAAEASASNRSANQPTARPRTQTFSRPEALKKPPPVPRQASPASAPPPVPPQAARRPPPPPPQGASDRQLRSLYDEYINARRKNNERVDNLSFNKVRQQIEKMKPRLQKKYGKDSYDFKVVVKDGRVGLKPVGK